MIGYVGDSGNAENTSPHLHFELRYPDGSAFNSYPSLREAELVGGVSVEWVVGSIEQSRLLVDDTSITTSLHPLSGIAVWGDFDADSGVELAVGGDPFEGWLKVELDGQEEQWSEPISSPIARSQVGDFDGDGDDDVALLSPSYQWTGLRSSPQGFSVESWGRFGGTGWAAQLVGDFDGDDSDDLLSFHPGTRTWWLSRLGDGKWVHTVYVRYGTAYGWQTHLAVDYNGDGKDDLVSFHPGNGTWWGTRQGHSPRLLFDVSTNTGWQHLATGDINGDGSPELIMYHPSNGTWWKIDLQKDRVSLWATFSTRLGWTDVMLADVNADGSDDLITRHSPSGRVWAIVGGTEGRSRFLGEFLAGVPTEIWQLGQGPSGPLIAALERE